MAKYEAPQELSDDELGNLRMVSDSLGAGIRDSGTKTGDEGGGKRRWSAPKEESPEDLKTSAGRSSRSPQRRRSPGTLMRPCAISARFPRRFSGDFFLSSPSPSTRRAFSCWTCLSTPRPRALPCSRSSSCSPPDASLCHQGNHGIAPPQDRRRLQAALRDDKKRRRRCARGREVLPRACEKRRGGP